MLNLFVVLQKQSNLDSTSDEREFIIWPYYYSSICYPFIHSKVVFYLLNFIELNVLNGSSPVDKNPSFNYRWFPKLLSEKQHVTILSTYFPHSIIHSVLKIPWVVMVWTELCPINKTIALCDQCFVIYSATSWKALNFPLRKSLRSFRGRIFRINWVSSGNDVVS